MISVILIWLYMFITTFTIGFGVLRVITRHIPYHARKQTDLQDNFFGHASARTDLQGGPSGFVTGAAGRVWHMDAYLMCGIVCVTVYAQIFSLFAGVGLVANVILCVGCALIWWFDRAAFQQVIQGLLFGRKDDRGTDYQGKTGDGTKNFDKNNWAEGNLTYGYLKIILILFLFLLFAYGTSRGMIHYDTSLYHAQSIRWIEEYGVVKGLGNLHCRLAYNSSSFALSALYSMAFLGGRSYHCCAGFLAFILAKICLEVIDYMRGGKLCVSDFARVMGIYYLVNIFDEMISPASDYFMVLLAFYIVIRWLDLLCQGEKEILSYALLCVLGVFLMTVKLSAALILLLVVWPAYFLIRDKKWREILAYLCLGIVTALPYFIRNVVISGWLVYPFTQIDLFAVRWKIPKGIADYDAREIQVWGRGYTDVARYDISMREWLPGWFQSLGGSDKAFVLLAVISVCVLFICAAGMVCGWWKRRWDLLIVQAAVAASFVFWLGTSPLIRYGCVYVYLMPAVVFGGIYEVMFGSGRQEQVRYTGTVRNAADKETGGLLCGRLWVMICRAVQKAVVVMAALFVLYKGIALGQEIVRDYINDYWLVQKDYENYETYSYEIEGITFYLPVEGDQTGYESFPSAPAVPRIGFLGEGITDGFYSI